MRRPRSAVLALAGVVVAAVAVLIGAGLSDTLVYYRTPTEIGQSTTSTGKPVRLGGQVIPGSVHHEGTGMTFRLGDGDSEVVVFADGAVPNTFREGQGAVIEGVLQPDGTFRAESVAVKHSNEYRPPNSTARS